jgi:hypothetical protein
MAVNLDGVARLRRLVQSLDESDLSREAGHGWTIATELAHLAFWDRLVAERWNHFDRTGRFVDVSDTLLDVINAAGLAQWRQLPARAAAEGAVEAAEACIAQISSLSESAIQKATATGRQFMLDRTLHWNPHLDVIENAVGRPPS